MKKQRSKTALFFRLIYTKLFTINDTAHKIALGLGIGVFSGISPGTGPIAAVTLALLLRANRASALLGSLFTNTWLSFVTFLLSVKVGSVIMGLNWQDVQQNWEAVLQNAGIVGLLKLSTLKIILPVILGYLVVAVSLGFIVYTVTFIALICVRSIHKSR